MKLLQLNRAATARILALLMLGLASCRSSEELKSEQYFVTGQQLYMTHCANCHQMEGKGMSNLYPPIAGSPILSDKARVACIIQYGMSDTIVVNGKKFSRPMPPNPKLTEIEIAEIVSFVSMKWGKDSVYTPIEVVHKALAECKAD
ncbi:mono/diheme cytochrome c family protein [Dyadobacter sp. BE34]|uniref:Mono/diheme cytochrome c family protein n=1 Tax=Dyadobacter fermentans TaxID=94254 RepID=A0ABU1QSS5_9BACT|nr:MULTISPECIES: cytochrome c [Dyadobacter]MDR6804211.1 mono/diheme cytochrome c family protein [Dyadobacter fermentans]MDR7041951.1 mono/diheme cytochrome c family protein [Dyadobacter sp. BE242]MDR7196354.1 mono/diheme cytochrome c family protein [Dyadobacter sp. BE34]MDR7213101.1 mono/diheme cytochrome c family protein [Dyadobacter sp. BE31]MDR7261760.1 mono/diheme cytochrome c family protein [Dyadobacter sp. BE32]